jgi:hypothetical protein
MSLARLSGFNGCIYEGSTNQRTGIFYAFVVNADAVVSAMTITKQDGTTTSGVTLFNISSATLKQGSFFPVSEGSYISAITLASGSIILYNK